MLDEITSAIDATTDASSRKGLRRCLRLLSEAISNWGGHALAPSGLVIAGATSRGAVVLHADAGWPPFDEALAARLRQEFAPDAVALALADSIESPSFQGEAIVTGTALLLGRAGIAACVADSEAIAEQGQIPVLALLIERQRRRVTTLITVAAVAPALIH